MQILASLLLANVFHAAQRQIAQQAGVEAFEVCWSANGRALVVIRASARRRMLVPDIGWRPPSDLVTERAPRYAQSPDGRKKKTAS